MPETVRKENDRINIVKGLDSPLLPRAVVYFKRVFEDMNAALAESPYPVRCCHWSSSYKTSCI